MMRTIDLDADGDELTREVMQASAMFGITSAQFIRAALRTTIATIEQNDENAASYFAAGRKIRSLPSTKTPPAPNLADLGRELAVVA